jgi:Mn-dependent DtxR family transcriptional regulator
MSLTPVQKDVLLFLLNKGDDIPANIADGTKRHSKSVSRVLTGMDESLLELGLVEDKGRGVYSLTDEGEERARSISKGEF